MHLIAFFFHLWLVASSDLDPSLYQTSVEQYQNRQYPQAKVGFLRILGALERHQKALPTASKQAHLLRLGQIDVLFYLSRIAQAHTAPRQICRYLERMKQLLQQLPPTWKTWPVQPHLHEHVRKGQNTFATLCPTVPTVVRFVLSPPSAILSLRESPQQPWKRSRTRTLQTLAPALWVKISAPQYKEVQRMIPLARWRVHTVKTTLTRLPLVKPSRVRPRPALGLLRRRPPPPRLPSPTRKPFYTTWWFWTLTGVVLVGGATAIILPLTLPRTLILETDPNRPIRVFGP